MRDIAEYNADVNDEHDRMMKKGSGGKSNFGI